MAALAALAVSLVATPGWAATTDPVVRIAALHPFSVDAPSNVSMGSGAAFESASSTRTAALLKGTPSVNSSGWSIAVAVAKDSDPLVTLKNTSTGLVRTIRMPSGAQVTTGTDKAMTVVQPDGYTAFECYKMTRVSATLWTSTHIVPTDLRTNGLAGGTRAAGVSQLVGLIRTEEVAAAKIPHTIAVSIPDSMLKMGPVWPARTQDSNAATNYKGSIAMGTMMGIPPSVNLASLGLSVEGMALGKALQDYGAHVVDRSETVAIYAEPLSDQAAVMRMRVDYRKLFLQLRVITNNTATNISGGGTRRQPAAAGFESAPGQAAITSVAPGDRQATVGWTAPASTGGTSITGYTVTASSGATVATDGAARTAVVGGLTAGESYTFTVTARNAVAAGAVSATSAPVKLAFSDVPASSYFAPHVDWFVASGIGSGVGDGTFGATTAITREELAGYLYRNAGSPAVTATTSAFTDVSVSRPAFAAITWMASRGITNGTLQANGTRTFNPTDSVSRGAMAAFLYRNAGSPAFTPPSSSPFVDVATTSSFYREISWLSVNGISAGTTGGTTYEPAASMTREVTAMFMHRADGLA